MHGMQEGVDLMVSVRLGRIASTMVGDRQVRVSLLSILYCASLIRSCSRCSSTCNMRSVRVNSFSKSLRLTLVDSWQTVHAHA